MTLSDETVSAAHAQAERDRQPFPVGGTLEQRQRSDRDAASRRRSRIDSIEDGYYLYTALHELALMAPDLVDVALTEAGVPA